MFFRNKFNRASFLGAFEAGLVIFDAMMEQKKLTYKRAEMIDAAKKVRSAEDFQRFEAMMREEYWVPKESVLFRITGLIVHTGWTCQVTVQMADLDEYIQMTRGNVGIVMETRKLSPNGMQLVHEHLLVKTTSTIDFVGIPLYSFKAVSMNRFFVRSTSTMSLLLKVLAAGTKGDNRSWFGRLSADWDQKFPA